MNATAESINRRSETSWRDSYKTAQMISLPDVTRICGNQAGQLVQDLARGVGCPEEFILMPLLSCCSALMGNRSEIRVHKAWSEPPVLWFIIAAGTGTRKSAAIRQVLTPLMLLTQKGQLPIENQPGPEKEIAQLSMPIIYTGSIDMLKLQTLAQNGGGCVLQMTEHLEDSHRQLGAHHMLQDDMSTSCTQLQDLYEAFPGNFAVTSCHVSRAAERGERTSFALCAQSVCFNQCGFASPDYVVSLTMKAPSWLSGRFLVSCPVVEESSATWLAVLEQHSSDSEENEESSCQASRAKRVRRNEKLTLKDVYFHIARAHGLGAARHYLFSSEAVRHLRSFQEEEWQTIVTQLGGEDNGGAVGKSLGQIIRLAGVLKALSVAVQDCLGRPMQDVSGQGVILINSDDILKAVELGKYFLEQKLSMTFMVSTGFFRSRTTSWRQAEHCEPTSCRSQTTSDYSHMPPPQAVNSLYGSSKVVNNSSAASPVALLPNSPGLQQQQLVQQDSTAAMPQSQPFPFNMSTPVPGMPSLGSRNHSHLSTPSHTPPEIDVAQLPATWIPSTPEEEMAEMSQAAEFVQLEPAQFVAVHARRVKRLLECFDDGCGVSATTAAQKSIAPPVRVAGTNNRHPAWASALFFQKVADLGLGVAEQVRHPTNGRVYWRFKRKCVSELSAKNLQLLQYLRIDMLRYSRLGQPLLHVPPGVQLDPVPSGISLDDDGSSNCSSKGNNSPLPNDSIKQELV